MLSYDWVLQTFRLPLLETHPENKKQKFRRLKAEQKRRGEKIETKII